MLFQCVIQMLPVVLKYLIRCGVSGKCVVVCVIEVIPVVAR